MTESEKKPAGEAGPPSFRRPAAVADTGGDRGE